MSRLCITTHKLHDLFNAWAAKEQHQTSVTREKHCSEILACLKIVDYQLRRFASWAALSGIKSLLPPDIDFSIRILLSTLSACIRSIFGEVWFARSTQGEGIRENFLESKMRESGWCISHCYSLARRYDPCVLYYIYLLGPEQRSRDHSRCSEVQCMALNVDAKNYRTAHRDKACNCQDVDIDIEKVNAILNSGGIPLICLRLSDNDDTEDHKGIIRLKVIESSPKIGYVAISHVWSDGIGNVTRNSLPACQIIFLRDCVSNLVLKEQPPPEWVCLWLDTLCVPLSPENMRKSALRLMRRTYKEASHVLVLDGDLMTLSKDMPRLEMNMRAATSNWSRRLWTLQESLLARDLWVQLSDDAVSFLMTGEGLFDDEMKVWQPINLAALQNIYSLNWLQHPQASKDLYNLVRSCQSRSTSKSQDEAFCLATLLDINPDKILAAANDRKMIQFWLSLARCSVHILFMGGLKIQEPGFRWAPSSLLQSQSEEGLIMTYLPEPYLESESKWKGLVNFFVSFLGRGIHSRPVLEEEALVTERGLMFSSRGLTIDSTDKPLGRTFIWVEPKSGRKVFVRPKEELHGSFAEYSNQESNFAVIYIGLVNGGCPYAALVSSCKVEYGIIFARFVRNVVLGIVGLEEDPLTNARAMVFMDQREDSHQDVAAIVSGGELPPDQVWCIG